MDSEVIYIWIVRYIAILMEIYMDSEVDINLNQDIDLFPFQYSLLVRLYQALLPVQGHLAALHVHHLRHHHHHLHLRLRR